MKLRLEGQPHELAKKAPAILKAVAERLPASELTSGILEILEKATVPKEEPVLKHPAMRELHDQVAGIVEHHYAEMHAAIAKVLDKPMRKADHLPGGLADRKKPEDFDPAALAEGIKVELEHTNDRSIAREIAMDHLTEDPKYYEKLRRMEAQKAFDQSRIYFDEDFERYERVKAALIENFDFNAADFGLGGSLEGWSTNQLLELYGRLAGLEKTAEAAGTVHRWTDGRMMRKEGDGEWVEVEHPHHAAVEHGQKIKFKAHEKLGGHEHEFHVAEVKEGKVRLSRRPEDKFGTWMPAQSVKHFQNDLQGKVEGPPSKRPEIQAVLDGKAEFLGKGNDGMAFRVGDKVVKVSTTVPFQPENPGHRTPNEAAAMLERQKEAADHLRSQGVKGIQESEVIRHGEKAFQIKDHVEIPDKLTKEQLDQAQDIVRSMHEKGWALNDEIQVGIDRDGNVVMFDIGNAAPARAGGEGIFKDTDRKDDVDRIKMLYRKHGADFEPRGKVSLKEEFEALIDRERLQRAAKTPIIGKRLREQIDSAKQSLEKEIKRTAKDDLDVEIGLEDLKWDYDRAIAILDGGKP